MFQSPFDVQGIPTNAKVIFVADMFANEYVGGAELTTQALIGSCPLNVYKIKSRSVTLEMLRKGKECFWIFGNFAELNPQLIPSIVANLQYSIVEYDYKYCRYRSPEKHAADTKSPCDCHDQINGKLISAFMYGASSLWWMSEKQMHHYHSLFPFLNDKPNIVLSSVFDDKTIATIKLLRESSLEKKGWIVLGSNSWIKGAEAAKAWCESNDKEYEVIWNLTYEQTLAKLAASEGFVYLPAGKDTCPRMVIEAKLLGCKLELNDNVQHKDEEWFASDDVKSIEEYLYASKKLFWNGIQSNIDWKPTISGYVTTYNCISQKYPFKECIQSMLQFCDEVCVVDGGSTDDTTIALYALQLKNLTATGGHHTIDNNGFINESKIKVKVIKRDWNDPRFAIFDGMQKAEARKMCTSEYCWQMDSDEVVHEDDAKRITDLCKKFPKEIDVIALPVIEYWGGPDKVRLDVTPWKWRLTRNKLNITHGIPKMLRRTDSDGNLCAAEGTDGCDVIDATTYDPVPFVSFYSQQIDDARKLAIIGDQNALITYQQWFNNVVNNLPSVFHYSWYDLARKIRLYRDYWTRHWESLSGKDYVDNAESNMMFDIPWSEVTDDMIEVRASELKDIGGWIWHKKWDGRKTPHIVVERSQPALMKK